MYIYIYIERERYLKNVQYICYESIFYFKSIKMEKGVENFEFISIIPFQ